MSSDNRYLLLSTNHKKVSSFARNECDEWTRMLSQRAEALRGLQTRGTDLNLESHLSTGTRSIQLFVIMPHFLPPEVAALSSNEQWPEAIPESVTGAVE
jgi:hypothetical protein